MNKLILLSLFLFTSCSNKGWRDKHSIIDVPKRISTQQCVELSKGLICRISTLVKINETTDYLDMCFYLPLNNTMSFSVSCEKFESIKKYGVED
jgi:hypothetical protein